MKLHILMRRTYSDFDMAYDTPVAVSESLETLNMRKAELTAKLTERDKKEEVSYKISSDKVTVL